LKALQAGPTEPRISLPDPNSGVSCISPLTRNKYWSWTTRGCHPGMIFCPTEEAHCARIVVVAIQNMRGASSLPSPRSWDVQHGITAVTRGLTPPVKRAPEVATFQYLGFWGYQGGYMQILPHNFTQNYRSAFRHFEEPASCRASQVRLVPSVAALYR
jgi:hypothetical protein